jgi:hypothetical protein
MSLKFCSAARSTLRPMRPKPLIPILIVMLFSKVKKLKTDGFGHCERSARNDEVTEVP